MSSIVRYILVHRPMLGLKSSLTFLCYIAMKAIERLRYPGSGLRIRLHYPYPYPYPLTDHDFPLKTHRSTNTDGGIITIKE